MVSVIRYAKIEDYPKPAMAIGMKNGIILVATRSNTTLHGGDNNANIRILKSTDGGRTWSEIATIDVANLDELRTGHVMFVNPLTGMFILFNQLYDASAGAGKGTNVYEVDENGNYYLRISGIGSDIGAYVRPLFEPIKVGDEWYLYCLFNSARTSPWTWKIIRIKLSDWTYEEVADFATELDSVSANPDETSAIIDLENNVIYAFVRHSVGSAHEIRLWRFDFDPSTGNVSNPTHIALLASNVGSPTGCIRIPNTNIAYLLHYQWITSPTENSTVLRKVDLSTGEVLATYDVSIEGYHGDEAANGSIILVDPSIERSNGKYVAYAVYENGDEGSNGDYDGNFFAAIELDEIAKIPTRLTLTITPL